MKKIFSSFLVVAMMLAVAGVAKADSDLNQTDGVATVNIPVSLDIDSTISLACDNSVTMGAIPGVGTSVLDTNSATCNVSTNNSLGYELTWAAASTNMVNANGDTIASYTEAVAGAPEAWSVAAADSEWGATVDGDDADAAYAAGTLYTAVPTAADVIATRGTETGLGFDGIDTILTFEATVGANHWQPTGTYTNSITMTATTL